MKKPEQLSENLFCFSWWRSDKFQTNFKKQLSNVFNKKPVLKNFAIFKGKHLCWSLFLIKLQGLQLYLKDTPTQVFSCEYCEIFKKTYFEEYLQTATITFFSKLEG